MSSSPFVVFLLGYSLIYVHHVEAQDDDTEPQEPFDPVLEVFVRAKFFPLVVSSVVALRRRESRGQPLEPVQRNSLKIRVESFFALLQKLQSLFHGDFLVAQVIDRRNPRVLRYHELNAFRQAFPQVVNLAQPMKPSPKQDRHC
jgi:hypothetical protein